MIKILLVGFLGLLEQILYTSYLIAVDKRQTYLSTLWMFIYMSLYLFIVAYSIKDSNAIPLLITYALACAIGNYLTMLWEKRKNSKTYNEKTY